MLIIREYLCDLCEQRFESIEDRNDDERSKVCGCGGMGSRVPSAVMCRMPLGSVVTRGRPDAPPPGCVSTEALADGMPLREWKEKIRDRGKKMDEHRKALGVDPKVFV